MPKQTSYLTHDTNLHLFRLVLSLTPIEKIVKLSVDFFIVQFLYEPGLMSIIINIPD